MTIEALMEHELIKFNNASHPNDKSNILYNIITLKAKIFNSTILYQDTKKFFDLYIESIKLADYGYDSYNYDRIDKLISYLHPDQQISILQYIISVSCRELPEYERSWFITRKHNAEIQKILKNQEYSLFFKMVFLYVGQSLPRLLTSLLILFFITYIALLPAPCTILAIFQIQYENYSQNPSLNHLMNILSLYSDLDNNLKIIPINLVGLIILIAGKVIFILLIVNFIYLKISDKISQR